MNEIDFLLDKAQQKLDALRVAWKTRGCPDSCEDEIEDFIDVSRDIHVAYLNRNARK